MKFVSVLLVVAFVSGCAMHKEMEVQVGHAELVRIDTLYRYPDPIKQLTWKDENNTEYISIADIRDVYQLGTRIRMLRQR